MLAAIAQVTLQGVAPMTHSHQHDEPRLEGESHDAYDIRTWRKKLNVNAAGTSIVLRAHGVQQCLSAAAKYSSRQIPGQGKKTWTKKFESGIMILRDPELNIDPMSVDSLIISANADGVRGSGKRVPRRFPVIPEGWKTTFDVTILDPIITKDVFAEMVALAGMFIGLGQFRPEKGGTNGRFKMLKLAWEDNRQIAA